MYPRLTGASCLGGTSNTAVLGKVPTQACMRTLFPAIGILRLDAPHDMLLVCEAGEFVILFMLPGVRSTSCWRDVAGLYTVQYLHLELHLATGVSPPRTQRPTSGRICTLTTFHVCSTQRL
jgi:hypothetical protein